MKKPILFIALLCVVSIVRAQTTDSSATNKTDTVEKFYPVEVIPEFPGGLGKFSAYIEKNRSKKIDAQGRVFVTFVVEKDGSLTDIKVLRSLSPEADAEAIRLMAEGPKWKPGMALGKPCRVQYNIPVAFN